MPVSEPSYERLRVLHDECIQSCSRVQGLYDESRAEVERLREALTEAHRQLNLLGFKGPKQIGRALMTMERALGINPDAS